MSATTTSPIDCLNPDLPSGLRSIVMPVVDASPDALRDFGSLVDQPEDCRIEIVQWPARGRRPLGCGHGRPGWHDGECVHQRVARRRAPPQRMLLWHANYHPDGGQLFFPQQRQPFYVPLAPPGDDIRPEHFGCLVEAPIAA